jgi:GTP-binding protein
MTNRKSIAKISGTPGKTRTINFFNLNDNLYFVDLPGYGYASVAKHEKQKWGSMIEGYLMKREVLKLVISIIDIRHEPTKDDIMMIEWIKASGLPLVVVASKADKLTRNQVNQSLALIRKILKMSQEDILIPFSSVTSQGREELWEKIETHCGLNPL